MTQTAIKDAFGELRPGADLASLEAAARSRSEADWIVGMNATRAATIRLRSAFDGAVSLGRVQTPTLAILARREQEIREFVPEPYWVVDASFDPVAEPSGRAYEGRYHAGANPRLKTAEEAAAIVAACRGPDRRDHQAHEKSEQKQRPPLLYDLTRLQSDASSRYGFTLRRTLAAAQRLYEEHTALTYPRTNSRYLPSDMIAEIKPIARLVGERSEYAEGVTLRARARRAAAGARGQRRARSPTTTRSSRPAPTTTRSTRCPRTTSASTTWSCAASWRCSTPRRCSRTRASRRRSRSHVFRTRGKRILVPGWRAVYGETADVEERGEDDEGREQQLPRLEQGETAAVKEVASEAEGDPAAAALQRRLAGRRSMETAGKLVDDDELREAMKDSGIGTPATRAAIIERLIQVGYVERDGRALVVTEKGMNVIRLLGEHALTSPGLTGEWEARLAKIETGEDSREAFMGDIVKFTESTVGELDTKLKGVRIERANLGPCPVCGRDIIENRKGYSCWSREDPGLRLRDLEVQGRQAAARCRSPAS